MATTLNFGKLFGKSPFKPIKKHMSIAAECASYMPDAISAFFNSDKDTLKADTISFVQKQMAALP